MASAKAIETLRAAFPDQLLLPETEEFKTINKSYLSLLQSDITPAAIFLPKTKDDVVKFVKTVKPLALAGEAPFAVRGAGQQPVQGCSNIAGGITLDLRNLSGFEIKEGSVSINAGERWGPVYEALQAQGEAVAGGRSALNGIGGLALAGGLSFFSSREGFICDNVNNFEVILASGEIVNANEKENKDLWLSLRGGGNNFGIVTRFDLRTFKQGPFWGGSLFYFPADFPSQIDALVEELKKPDATDETHIMLSIGYAAAYAQISGLMCCNQLYYTQDVQNPDVLKPFAEPPTVLAQLSTMRTMTLKDAAAEQTQMSNDGIRCAYMNTTVKADPETLKEVSNIYGAAIEPLKPLEGVTLSLTLQPYPVSLLKKCVTEGGNSLGLDPNGGPLVSVLFLTWWKNADDDEKIMGTLQKALEKVDEDATARGTSVPFKYMNYAYGFQDPIASYGSEIKTRLQEASKKYDPEGLFQKGVPGGFKLFA